MVTMAQDIFDSNRDYIEKDKYGNIIGQWADYFPQQQYSTEAINIPESNTLPDYHAVITYSGTKPVIKLNGNYRKLTVRFYDKHDCELDDIDIDGWSFSVDGVDITALDDNPFNVITYYEDNTLDRNQIKINCSGSNDYLGKVLTVNVNSGGVVASQQLEVVGM